MSKLVAVPAAFLILVLSVLSSLVPSTFVVNFLRVDVGI
jgi:hypothetical protein